MDFTGLCNSFLCSVLPSFTVCQVTCTHGNNMRENPEDIENLSMPYQTHEKLAPVEFLQVGEGRLCHMEGIYFSKGISGAKGTRVIRSPKTRKCEKSSFSPSVARAVLVCS